MTKWWLFGFWNMPSLVSWVLLLSLNVAVGCLALSGCMFVGNSPEERKHRKYQEMQEDIFNRQSYNRMTPEVRVTEAYFVFTNRLYQLQTEPMDLDQLGNVMKSDYGSNVLWKVVTTAFGL